MDTPTQSIDFEGTRFLFRERPNSTYKWACFRTNGQGIWFPIWFKRLKDAEAFAATIHAKSGMNCVIGKTIA